MRRAEQHRLIGLHEMYRSHAQHSVFDCLARAIYYEVEAHVPLSEISKWHGFSEKEILNLHEEYLNRIKDDHSRA